MAIASHHRLTDEHLGPEATDADCEKFVRLFEDEVKRRGSAPCTRRDGGAWILTSDRCCRCCCGEEIYDDDVYETELQLISHSKDLAWERFCNNEDA